MKEESAAAAAEAKETTSIVRQYEARHLAAKTMVGDLLAALVDEIKHLPQVWQKLSEAKQGELIERLTNRVEENVIQAVHIIASENRPAIEATLDQVTRKDSIKAVLVIPSSIPQRHELLDACKQKVLVVLPDADGYFGGKDQVKADKDQPEIPLNSVQ